MTKVVWTKEKLRKLLLPLVDTLNRNATEAYHRHLREDGTSVSNYNCEDCKKFLGDNSAVVEAMMKGEKTTCPECGGLVVEHTPEPAKE